LSEKKKRTSNVRYAYGITAALLFGGTVATLALQSPGSAQSATAEIAAAGVAEAPRAGAPMSFADLVAKLQPAVVNVNTKQKIEVGVSFNPFTGEQRSATQEQGGTGSGFIISADGLIVTNNHVIAGEDGRDVVDTVTVRLSDGRELSAKIVSRDIASDLALLKVDAANLPFVEFGDSSKSRVGDWVIAIGNPLGIGSSVTAGIVSALQRTTGQGGAYDRFIQTDTAINRGNSGGPLFNLNGQVVGINNRLISPVGVNIGLNFAIPSESAIPVVEAMKKGVTLARGYLGIGIAAVDEDVAAALGLPKDRGEVIQTIQPGQAGEKSGLKQGDVVTKVAGKDVTPEQTLSYIVANTKPGTRVPLEVIRDGKTMSLTATVGTRPAEDKIAARPFNPDDDKPQGKSEGPATGAVKTVRDSLGFSVLPLTGDIARAVGIDPATKGVVIDAVSRDSDAAQRGFRRGDVIMGANYKPTPNAEELATQVSAAKKAGRTAIILQVRRRGIDSAMIPIKIS
jgi:serine protease Do